jgi:hypothetical protein
MVIKKDIELMKLTQYLLGFQDVKDVRVKIKEDFKLEKFLDGRSEYRLRRRSNH